MAVEQSVALRVFFFKKKTGCIISLQSNPVITDTEGAKESVRFKRVEFIANVRVRAKKDCLY